MRYARYPVCGADFEVYAKYSFMGLIGTGAYGDVCAFTNTETGEKVAIKKIRNAFQHRSTAMSTLREIMLLRYTDHDNIIPLRDIIVPAKFEEFNDAYIAHQLMDSDLHRVLLNTKLSDDHCQFFLYQLLRALKYLHSANILHRDLKPSNILINCEDCLLKICDFGLARPSLDDGSLTQYVVTRPYRAPELLLGSRLYTVAVDMWSVGCILVEMLTGEPLFPVRSRQEHPVQHLRLITELLGSPDVSDFSFLQHEEARVQIHSSLSGRKPKPLAEKYPHVNSSAWDLVEKLLRFDPTKRLTAEEALEHPYLAHLHDISDEPTCDIQFNLDYYDSSLTVEHIRRLIWIEASRVSQHVA
ncbi:hypothetical protein O6H91_13G014000 [Diphasiastrum complanatum]|uniref:Uncharacterized protein n=1 Tax=Diphasiastrum complanatum TaxID=34168 RepID=A0ACC2BSI6_DIPCM|nr:hypothetical protein O6H91_Y098300 [Diphasiastrum complanatum]KAJ7532657.1 hypothetical protein O6H91_13G014000 [Diphasiastrum complanatum]